MIIKKLTFQDSSFLAIASENTDSLFPKQFGFHNLERLFFLQYNSVRYFYGGTENSEIQIISISFPSSF